MRELELWRDKVSHKISHRRNTECSYRSNYGYATESNIRYESLYNVPNQMLTFRQMEEFTRECLEVDKDVNGERSEGRGLFVGTSMEQVYERAARLVKRTLDVEGAIVMDVSHVDVLETVVAESSTSISIHSDDPQHGTVNHVLNADEYSKLQEFFAKSPDGKICEGVLPAGLRPFLPSSIQYALGMTLVIKISAC
jgi:hypothetical protein